MKKFGPINQIKIFTFTYYGSILLLNGFLPLYLQFRGFDMAQIGILMSIGPFISVIANPFWGFVSDRYQNTRSLIMFMMAADLAIMTAVMFSNGFMMAAAILVVFYFFQTALSPLNTSLILQVIDGTGVKFGNIRLWGSLGYAVLAITSGPIMQYVGIGNFGWVFIVFMFVAILLSTGLPQRGAASPGKLMLRDFSKVIGNGAFVSLLFLSTLVFIPYAMNSAFLSIFIERLGGSEVSVGAALFSSAILEVPVFLLLDRYMPQTIKAMLLLIALATFLFALRWLLMSMAASPAMVIAIQFSHSVTFGVYFYAATLLCEQLVPKSYRATGQSLYALATGGISGLIAGYVGGLLFQYSGPRFMYLVGSFMALVGLTGYILLWLVLRKKIHSDSFSSYSS
ncbi:MAG TPA: MFS transporter [Bacilli bacterium]